MKEKNQYFIAIIPPQPLFDQALELKKHFEEQYQSKAALRSPPHITLHMPFEWRADKEENLVVALKKISSQLPDAQVVLRGFGRFDPRVIFIQVEPSEALETLQRALRKFCKEELGLFNADYKDLPFHPHITVAFRDLKKEFFKKAWNEFREKSFTGSFLADRIWLLKHDGKMWDPFREFPFGQPKSVT